MNNKEIKGFFLTFSDDEIAGVTEELVELGYTADPVGMKEFLMDALFAPDVEEEKPNPGIHVAEIAKNFLNENPEILTAGMSLMSKQFGKFMKGKKS